MRNKFDIYKLQNIVSFFFWVCIATLLGSFMFLHTFLYPIVFSIFVLLMGMEMIIEIKIEGKGYKHYLSKSGLWFGYPSFIFLAVVIWLAWLQ